MKKEVLLLCQFFYPEYVSSATLPTELAEELVDDGHQVDVIAGEARDYYDGDSVSKEEVYNGIKITRLNYSNLNPKTKIGRIVNFFSFFLSAMMKIPQISKYQTIIVYSNPPILPLIGYWAKRIGGAKLVFVGFDLYPDNAVALDAISKNGLIYKLMSYINKKVYANADQVVAISEDMKNYMLNHHQELKPERTVVIPNWYTGQLAPTTVIKNEKFRKIRKDWDKIVLYTGNMGEAQDLDTIVDSIILMKDLKKFEDTLFIFTGHGTKRYGIEDKLINHGVENAQFYDFLKGQDYSDVLNIADLTLVSLKKGIEGLGVPSKMYGYFAYNKPVLSIMNENTELAQNILAYDAGFNIRQGDTAGFIQVIEQIIDQPDLIKTFSQNSKKIHEELYKREHSLNKYKKLVNEIVN